MAMGSKAFESPLIGHARMRALFRALVEVRGLAGRMKERSLIGLEACWVAGTIDLQEGDLASNTGGDFDACFVLHIRSVGQRPGGRAAKVGEIRRTLTLLRCASPEVEGMFHGTAYERAVCAVGSAMALKADGGARVVLSLVRWGELSRREGRRLLGLMSQPGLPLVVIALPNGRAKIDFERIGGSTIPLTQLRTPVIPVDAGDAVAMYRVVQESVVRARTGGGAALIAGVPCGTDSVALLGSQLVRKGICTARWVERVAEHAKALRARD